MQEIRRESVIESTEIGIEIGIDQKNVNEKWNQIRWEILGIEAQRSDIGVQNIRRRPSKTADKIKCFFPIKVVIGN